MDLISQIVERAKSNKQRIVLPEGTEERTLKAANQVLTDGVADLILLGNPSEIMDLAREWGLGNIFRATIIDPENHPKQEEYAQLLCQLRQKKGMTIEEARKLVRNPLYLGCLIIKAGDADGQPSECFPAGGGRMRVFLHFRNALRIRGASVFRPVRTLFPGSGAGVGAGREIVAGAAISAGEHGGRGLGGGGAGAVYRSHAAAGIPLYRGPENLPVSPAVRTGAGRWKIRIMCGMTY